MPFLNISLPLLILPRVSQWRLQKLVAAEDSSEAYTTFTGVTRLKQGITPGNTYLDPPALNRSVTTPAPKAPSACPAHLFYRISLLTATRVSNKTTTSRSSAPKQP